MQMLAKEEESEAEVTWEDQQSINQFGKLNSRLQDVQEELKTKKKSLEDVQDASNDLLLMDTEDDPEDDTPVRFQIGGCFFHVAADDATERLEAQEEESRGECERSEEECRGIQAEMKELKARLYAKFGKSINLETD